MAENKAKTKPDKWTVALIVVVIILIVEVSALAISHFCVNVMPELISDSAARVNRYSKMFDADTGYLYSYSEIDHRVSIYDLKAPLAVMFDENYTDEEKDCAISALDETFEILHNINTDYSYKLCNKKEFDSYKNKLFFDVEESNERSNESENYLAYYSVSKSLIMLHRPTCNKETFKHELLHACGIYDVYDYVTEVEQGNTLLNTNRANKKSDYYDDFSPNDVRLLAILNIDKNADETEKQRVLDYVMSYEKTFSEKVFAAIDCDKYVFSTASKFNCNYTCDYAGKRLVKIQFSDSEYIAKIYDETGTFLESAEGRFIKYDCGVVITNFRTNTLFENPDFSEGGVYSLYLSGKGKAKECKVFSVFHGKTFKGVCY